MKQDSMIIEYRGESLRRSMADAREKAYRAKDMDCYLFNINDDVVIDATVKGTIGRFTVGCYLFQGCQTAIIDCACNITAWNFSNEINLGGNKPCCVSCICACTILNTMPRG